MSPPPASSSSKPNPVPISSLKPTSLGPPNAPPGAPKPRSCSSPPALPAGCACDTKWGGWNPNPCACAPRPPPPYQMTPLGSTSKRHVGHVVCPGLANQGPRHAAWKTCAQGRVMIAEGAGVSDEGKLDSESAEAAGVVVAVAAESKGTTNSALSPSSRRSQQITHPLSPPTAPTSSSFPFILRCLKEWARAHGHTLYVACVNFTNAFPLTDQPTLWLKLFRLGMGGKIFDWLRMLYDRMAYYVRHGDMESEQFKALIGLLTGDTADNQMSWAVCDVSVMWSVIGPVIGDVMFHFSFVTLTMIAGFPLSR
ncbi:hypothetical protein B0H10DRAFT_2198817 [Mycena sp. CBHHK59/15]|nr:hypothetical protein B0H10DRAFT_2198817 [Mycena sp. CBHHK59/15]